MSTTLRMFTAVACCACAMTIARPSAQTGGAWFERFATELKNLPKPQTPVDASTELRRKDLAVVAAVIAPVAALEDNHEYDAARLLYVDAIAKIDPTVDRELLEAVRAELRRLDTAGRRASDLEARALIAVGDRQMARAAYGDADATYSKVVAKKAAVSPEIFEQANRKAADARQLAAHEPSFEGLWNGFLAASRDYGFQVLKSLLYVAAMIVVPFAVLILVIRLLPPRRETVLSLEDRTAVVPSPTANASLTDQMRREMALPRPTRDGLRVEMIAEVDGSSFGHAWVGVQMPDLGTALQSAPITFGLLSINPLPLFNLVRPLFRRRRARELYGWLATQGTTTVCVVDLRSSSRTRPAITHWEATSTATNARDQVVRDVALQVMLALDRQTTTITRDWRSLKALLDGIQSMKNASGEPATRLVAWSAARVAFQEAILIDGENWLARMNFGDTLRKVGLNRPAAEQFEETLRSTRLPPGNRPIVRYNQAIALQKTDDDDDAKQGRYILQELQTEDLHPVLHLLVVSAQTAAEANQFARRFRGVDWRPHDSPEYSRVVGDVREAVQRQQGTCDELQEAIHAQGVSSEESNVVLAVAFNALGQLRAWAGQPHEAMEAYRRAMTLLPNFVEPLLNLADLLMNVKRTLGPRWPIRAEQILLSVRALDASNARANILLGTLYSSSIFSRFSEAEQLLTSALPNIAAALQLGEVFVEEGKFPEAVGPLLSVVAQDENQQWAKILLARVALELPEDRLKKCELLLRARSWIDTLQGAPGRAGRYAKTLAPSIGAACAKCAAAVRNAAPPPAAEDEPTAGAA